MYNFFEQMNNEIFGLNPDATNLSMQFIFCFLLFVWGMDFVLYLIRILGGLAR